MTLTMRPVVVAVAIFAVLPRRNGAEHITALIAKTIQQIESTLVALIRWF